MAYFLIGLLHQERQGATPDLVYAVGVAASKDLKDTRDIKDSKVYERAPI